MGNSALTPIKATSWLPEDRIRTGRIEFARGLSTTLVVSRPQEGVLSGSCLAGPLGAAFWDFKTVWRLMVSVTHAPSRKTFVWNAI